MLTINRTHGINQNYRKINENKECKNITANIQDHQKITSFGSNPKLAFVASIVALGYLCTNLGSCGMKKNESITPEIEQPTTTIVEKNSNTSATIQPFIKNIDVLASQPTEKAETELTYEQMQKIIDLTDNDTRIIDLIVELSKVKFTAKDIEYAEKLIGAPLQIRSGMDSVNILINNNKKIKAVNVDLDGAYLATCSNPIQTICETGEIVIREDLLKVDNKTNKFALEAFLAHETGHLINNIKDDSLQEELHNFLITALTVKSFDDQYGNTLNWKTDEASTFAYKTYKRIFNNHSQKPEFIKGFINSYKDYSLTSDGFTTSFNPESSKELKKVLKEKQPPLLAQVLKSKEKNR
ncbi:MAG: hypothetical protein WCK67_11180 [bacterium]